MCLIHLDNICHGQIGNHGHGHVVTFKDRGVSDTDMQIEAQFSTPKHKLDTEHIDGGSWRIKD